MIGIGQVVHAADHSAMLALCDTYHFGVTHGIVADIDLDYAASVCVLWFVGDEPQTVAHWVEPCTLSAKVEEMAR